MSDHYSFPEDRYEPDPGRAEAYRACRDRGRDRAQNGRAVICGLARELGPRAHASLRALEAIGGLFADHRLVLYENDSRDQTPAVLRAWSAADPTRRAVTCERRGQPKWGAVRSPRRGAQMADYRERCRRRALELAGDFDWAVVVDTDIGRYSLDGLLHSIGSDGWDAMGSNGLFRAKGGVVQYDAWAWRKAGDPRPLGCHEVHPITPPRGAPPIPVLSCFGGMGLYRLPAFAAGHYAGADCEHVPFHRSLAAAGFGRIFMNPSQIVLYP